MKKLKNLLLLLTFFSMTASAQVTVTFPTLQSALDAMKLSTPTVTKTQLDSTNTSLRNYILGSFNNLQTWTTNQLALKADKGTVGVYGNVITLPANTYASEIRPIDYGKTYTNGKTIGAFYGQGYQYSPGINFDDAPDVIYQTSSYNCDPVGNRFTNDGSWWFGRIERHYDISPDLKNVFEPHIWGFADYNNTAHRSLSGYFSKITGQGFWAMEANIFKIASYINGASKDLFSVTDGKIQLQNTSNQLGIGLYHSNGTSFIIDMTGGAFKLTAPDTQIGQGYPLKLPISTPTGIQSKEFYVDQNGFVKVK